MPAKPLSAVVQFLDRLRAEGMADHNDADLLARFADQRDPMALEALVRRHGPIVLGACHRVLGKGPDADDAYQATFLVLARKASNIRKRQALGGWLHGVALNLARQTQTKLAVRRRREARLGTTMENLPMDADPSHRLCLEESGSIIDEELEHLPAACRAAIIACYLENNSTAEAAKQLGIPASTLKSRLERGRELLRVRLSKRGVGLSAAALAMVLTEQGRALARPALVRATVEAAMSYTISGAAAVSTNVAALAAKGVKVSALFKLKLAVVATFAVGLVGLAATVPITSETDSDSPSQVADGPTQLVKAKLGQTVVGKDLFGDQLPTGAIARLGTIRWRHDDFIYFVAVAPNGKSIITAAYDRTIRVWDTANGKEIRRFGPGLLVMPIPPNEPRLAESPQRPNDLVAVSTDVKLLSTRFEPQVVDLWEIETGRKQGSLKLEHHYDGGGMAFSTDGKKLAIASIFGQIRLWDIEAGKIIREFGKPTKSTAFGGLLGIRFSPDGKTLACIMVRNPNAQIGYYTIDFWDPETGTAVQSMKGEEGTNGKGFIPKYPHCVVYSPDSKLFACATRDSEVCVLRIEDGLPLRKWKVADEDGYVILAFSADSAKLYTKNSKKSSVQFREWDIRSGNCLRDFKLREEFTGTDNQSAMTTGRLAMSLDGKTLVTGSGSNALHFFDLDLGQPMPMLGGHTRPLTAVSFMPDGKSLWTSSFDSAFQWWDTANGKEIKRMPDLNKTGRAITADGRYWAICEDESKAISLVEDATGKEVFSYAAKVGAGPRRFFFSPDGGTLLVCDHATSDVMLYDVALRKERQLPIARIFFLDSLFFSADGRRFAQFSRGESGVLTVYYASTGNQFIRTELNQVRGLCGGAFSPDGRSLALDGCEGQVHFVELATGKVRSVLGQKYATRPSTMEGPPNRFHIGSIWNGDAASSSIAFSLDSRLLAHARQDKVLELWDVVTGKLMAEFAGHTGDIRGVAFAPDGQSVATASQDTTALIWDLKPLLGKLKR
jgi:RNA polymerase sigma factor (sigma-70 family)